MNLSAFIRKNEEPIILEWQSFAKVHLPSAVHMDRNELRDHILGLLRFIVEDLETPETEKERSQKAKGQGPKGGERQDGAAGSHGDLRFASGFDTIEMISEFRALRASVIKLWRAEWIEATDVLPDLLRFNESIDQVMTESLFRFIENSKNSGIQVVQILERDVRDPLLDIRGSAKKLTDNINPGGKEDQIISAILVSSLRIIRAVSEVIVTVESTSGMNQSSTPASTSNPEG